MYIPGMSERPFLLCFFAVYFATVAVLFADRRLVATQRRMPSRKREGKDEHVPSSAVDVIAGK